MCRIWCCSVAILLVVLANSGQAGGTDGGSPEPSRSASATAAQASQLRDPVFRYERDASIAVSKGGDGFGLYDSWVLPPIVNPARSYPPSCLAEPLPKAPIGPFNVSLSLDLAARDTSTGTLVREHVTITVWRIECSSTRRPQSATLLRINRDMENNGNEDSLVLFPDIRISQGALSYDDTSTGYNWLRLAELPNTKTIRTLVETPIYYSTTYVLESPSLEGGGIIDLNHPFRLRIDNQLASENQYEIDVPGYIPNLAYGAYPSGMPVTLYMSGNWYDPDASGEGLSLHVFDSPDEAYVSRVSYIWATFDSLGKPYWLYGEGNYLRFTFGVETTIAYRVGGVFAGAGNTAGPLQPWGTASLKFVDCNHLKLTYSANASLPDSVPRGSGTRVLQRLANNNALPCE